MPIILGTETLTLPDGAEVDVQIGLGLSVAGYRPPGPASVTGGTVGIPVNRITVSFSQPVTWRTGSLPGENVPRGLVFRFFRDQSYLAAFTPGYDYVLTYVSGKGTASVVLAIDTSLLTTDVCEITYAASEDPLGQALITNLSLVPINELSGGVYLPMTNTIP